MPRAGTITLHTSLTLLAELAEIIGRGKFIRPIQRAGLSAAALGAEAQLIVSGDRDLLVLGAFQGIPILPAPQALEHIATRTS